MAGIMSSLFGGPSSESILNDTQSDIFGSLGNLVNDQIGRAGPVYQGQRIANSTANQRGAFAGAPGAAQQNPNLNPAINSALSGAGNPDEVRQLFQDSLGPANLAFDRQLNEVGNRYGDVYGRSGALPEMAGRATAEYGMGLNQLLGQLTYNDQNAARDRQAGSIAPAVMAQQQQMQSLKDLFNIGTAEQGLNQQQLMGNYSQWQDQQWENNPALDFLPLIMGTQTKALGNQTGILPGTIGAVGGLASIGAAI
jgi:hypothetical protein